MLNIHLLWSFTFKIISMQIKCKSLLPKVKNNQAEHVSLWTRSVCFENFRIKKNTLNILRKVSSEQRVLKPVPIPICLKGIIWAVRCSCWRVRAAASQPPSAEILRSSLQRPATGQRTPSNSETRASDRARAIGDCDLVPWPPPPPPPHPDPHLHLHLHPLHSCHLHLQHLPQPGHSDQGRTPVSMYST